MLLNTIAEKGQEVKGWNFMDDRYKACGGDIEALREEGGDAFFFICLKISIIINVSNLSLSLRRYGTQVGNVESTSPLLICIAGRRRAKKPWFASQGKLCQNTLFFSSNH
jgi:hypothetical protein